MDLEAPADAWYVWIGVSAASIVIAGVVLGLPTGPPPDANAAANAIDRVAGSPYSASVVHQYEADEIRLQEGKTVVLRNDHGDAHSSIAFGSVVLVTDDERLENVTGGTPFHDEFESELDRTDVDGTAEFLARIADSRADTDGEWHPAGERLIVRNVRVPPDEATPQPRITAEVTDVLGDWEDHEPPSAHHATAVRFDYDGDGGDDAVLSARGVSHGGPGEVEYDATTTFQHRADSDVLEFAGADALRLPIDVDVTIDDDRTCSAEDITAYRDPVTLCDGREIRDPDEFAAETPQIEIDPETGEYHVTLVVAQ
ncbi:hypothetical protein EA462_02625 [Natrarchaeobius halalkaliphilus]|uniref:Uncharacterized protein n=1 Tax=Natrarchaeobius halalkaliphilus TaxID=1679091 RepID=A0A3N6LSY3_9EURY|nr:hypothetical protein [Natrarchaeobius halalkaliphilus]RQG93118.1 hypothetical protein EA462_02625 [Natrarchaeobius halalkaliphilus]